jgi:uncharacterized zinc-type alcohol dehydrogenase-like protein
VTRGGYSEAIVVDEDYVLRVPVGYDLASAAPLVCAGVTTYSPLKRWGVKNGTQCAIAGYGGLGHIALKIAKAMGADVSIITSHPAHKSVDALRNGAISVIDETDKKAMEASANSFDVILSTISVMHDVM